MPPARGLFEPVSRQPRNHCEITSVTTHGNGVFGFVLCVAEWCPTCGRQKPGSERDVMVIRGFHAGPVAHYSANAGCYFIGASRCSTSTAAPGTTPVEDRTSAFHETG